MTSLEGFFVVVVLLLCFVLSLSESVFILYLYFSSHFFKLVNRHDQDQSSSSDCSACSAFNTAEVATSIRLTPYRQRQKETSLQQPVYEAVGICHVERSCVLKHAASGWEEPLCTAAMRDYGGLPCWCQQSQFCTTARNERHYELALGSVLDCLESLC